LPTQILPNSCRMVRFRNDTYKRARGRTAKGKTEQTFMAMLKKVAIVVVAWVVCVLVYLEFFAKGR
jgi:hypothetical protein